MFPLANILGSMICALLYLCCYDQCWRLIGYKRVKLHTYNLLQSNLAEKTTHHKNALMAWQEADNEVKRLRVVNSEYKDQIISIQKEYNTLHTQYTNRFTSPHPEKTYGNS